MSSEVCVVPRAEQENDPLKESGVSPRVNATEARVSEIDAHLYQLLLPERDLSLGIDKAFLKQQNSQKVI